jgi:hypothetical protein
VIRPGNFFERFLSLTVGLGVDGARLLPRQAEVVEQPQHAVLAVGDAEALLDDAAQILSAPRAHAVAFRIGAAQDQGLQRRQLALVEPRPPAALGPIAEALDPLGIEPDHPIPQRLAVHPRQAGGPSTIHAVQRMGQTQQP